MHPRASVSRGLLIWIALIILAIAIAGCTSSSSGGGGLDKVTGTVVNGDGTGVIGATVYLVPVDEIDRTPITAQGILDGTTEGFDEPLEDAVNNAGAAFPQAVTDSRGRFKMDARDEGIEEDRDYYVFVQPNDGEYLPGGDICRISRPGSSILGTDLSIEVSSQPPPGAQFVGSTTCLSCHQGHRGVMYTAHKHGFVAMDRLGGLQIPDNFPDFFDSIDKFVEASVYTDGRVITFGDLDTGRGFDKFEVYEGEDPPQIGTALARGYLWKDTADGEFKITIENLENPGDPMSPMTLVSKYTYGAAVYKQRFLVGFPGRKGHYPFLQFQAYPGISTGSDDHYDRTRGVWRDYHLDYFWDTSANMLKEPPAGKTFEGNCAGCHFTGYRTYQDLDTGEWLADAVNDPNGAFDIDGDGLLDEVNTGCEKCHGAGSVHVDLNLNGPPSSRHIVDIGSLSPSREIMVCGRCHDRSQGNGTVKNDHLLNVDDEFAPPGISRAELLANYTSRKGPAAGNFWQDFEHSKSHHQQYADLIKSVKYRNDEQIVVCSDCHDVHADRTRDGFQEYRHNLVGDPSDPNSTLCARCHALDPVVHMIEETGVAHGGGQTECSSCHMPRTAKTGAGQYGLLLAPPTGGSEDVDSVYWMNDISSHLFDFVDKYSLGVAGEQPGKAMPSPYTNRCGTCHDASTLPFQTPVR